MRQPSLILLPTKEKEAGWQASGSKQSKQVCDQQAQAESDRTTLIPELPGTRPNSLGVQAIQLLQWIKTRTQTLNHKFGDAGTTRRGEALGVENTMEMLTRKAKVDIGKEITEFLAKWRTQ